MTTHFYFRKIFPTEFKQEIYSLYELGVESDEIDYIINLRIREKDLRLNE